jgi:RimJ/RimL family protein N-acetyltransferase
MIRQGKQIYLKEGFSEENYPLLLKRFTDIELVKYTSFAKEALVLKDVDGLKVFLAELESGPVFGIHDKGGRFIGYTSLSDYAGKKEGEFSIFVLDKESQGRGVGYETTMLMLDHAFHDLGLERVYLETSEFHEKVIGLYEKAGFRRTELVPNDRTVFHGGEWVESGSLFMEITKEAYEARQEGR